MISPHDMLDPWALSQSRMRKQAYAWLYENRNMKNAACMHALCQAEHAHMRRYGLNNPIAVVPNGVDVPDLETGDTPSPVPEMWQNRKRCLFLSRVHPKKGLIPMLDAIAACTAQLSDWVFLVAGPGNNGHRQEVETHIREKASKRWSTS